MIWRNDLQYALFIFTVVLLVISLVSPLYPRDQLLQHIPTIVALGALLVAARRSVFTNLSFACVVGFIVLHIVGARYVYSFVPYDLWSERVLGVSLSEPLGFSRNHYDRLVHFLFGCLAVPPCAELCGKYGRLSLNGALTFAVLFVLSAGALYEIFEWLLTVVMSPRDAEAYNGQQGDIWDAQKDMALAFTGSVVTALCCRLLTVVQRER